MSTLFIADHFLLLKAFSFFHFSLTSFQIFYLLWLCFKSLFTLGSCPLYVISWCWPLKLSMFKIEFTVAPHTCFSFWVPLLKRLAPSILHPVIHQEVLTCWLSLFLSHRKLVYPADFNSKISLSFLPCAAPTVDLVEALTIWAEQQPSSLSS